MVDALAGSAMDMSAAQAALGYSAAVAKKVMDTQELSAQGLLEILPPLPPMGEFLDTYA